MLRGIGLESGTGLDARLGIGLRPTFQLAIRRPEAGAVDPGGGWLTQEIV